MRSLLWVLVSFVAAPNALCAQASAKPNILFIAIDDLKPLIGAYGATQMHTPNMDRLAKLGTIFMSNYVQQAVCAPSRASLLTGQRADITKVWDLKTLIRDMNPDILTLPEYFRQNGYTTVGIGKVFDQRSVDKQFDAPSWSVPYQKVKPSDFASGFAPPSQSMYQNAKTRTLFLQREQDGRTQGLSDAAAKAYAKTKIYPAYEVSEDVPDDAYTDGAHAGIAVKTIAALAKAKDPFFYAVGFAKPHLPFVAPKKYWDMYEHSKITLAEFRQRSKDAVAVAYPSGNVEDATGATANNASGGELQNGYTDSLGHRLLSVNNQLSEATQRNLIHAYYASVSYIDAQVGKLLDELTKQGIAQNTIVVLWGDHGWHLGDHLLWAKHTNFEQATRAPLMIYRAGFQGNQKVTGLTEFVDVFPTLCELAGLTIPDHLAGTSLVPMLKDPKATGKSYAVSQYPRQNDRVMGYGIRTERFRYVAWLEKDFRRDALTMNFKQVATELYDMQTDPNETVNLAAVAKFRPVIAAHENLLMDFLKSQHPYQRTN